MDEQVYRGIIIRQSNYGEAHRMLSVFTETDGIIKAVRYGVRGKKTSNAAAFQVLSYGDFRLRPSGGGVMTALSLVNYFADITYALLGEANPDKRVLSLFLNIVYAAAYRNEPLLKLKCVYELKLMCASGYMPNLSSCGECGSQARFFSPGRGCVVCDKHKSREDIELSYGALSLMRYIVSCPDKKMLSFEVKNESIYDELGFVTQTYVSAQSGRTFSSLQYFRSMLDI